MAAPEGDEADLLNNDDGYKAPEKKTIDELVKLDAEDSSLQRYKESLLGGTKLVNPFPDDPRKFILVKLEICVCGGPTHEFDLKNLDGLKDKPIEMVEGSQYHVQVTFYVQHEIISGLRYAQKTTKSVLRSVDKVMLGSYAPRATPYVWRSEDEEVQSGALFRGHYNVTSVFTDDDEQEHLKFSGHFGSLLRVTRHHPLSSFLLPCSRSEQFKILILPHCASDRCGSRVFRY
ncbi:rho gdp dissociation inhibitor [Echinococcus multilocularis]|uniref:Rho gdp dissociation inhibitor n=1 Tax=Echinococcus multilocularis TaxID=6211 RepID=A0A068YG11_ECHMU|nr:rho gdp dissociation inhibitor [Echinococcus multilocularis]